MNDEKKPPNVPPFDQAYAQQYGQLNNAQYSQQWQQQQAQKLAKAPEPHPKLKGLTERLARLLRHQRTLETYMIHRTQDRDRHAVSDAANDLRELECEIRCVEEMIELVGGSVT